MPEIKDVIFLYLLGVLLHISAKQSADANFRIITISGLFYWFIFWALNGADKFLNGKQVFGLIWYGKDRNQQFGKYCERMGISPDIIEPILLFAGYWELGVAIFCILPLALLVARGASQMAGKFITVALVLSLVTFIGFCIFDIFVGDRAELLEHSTYIGVVLASYLAFEAERLIPLLKQA